MTQADAFLDALRGIVGRANVLTDGDLSAWKRTGANAALARRWLSCTPRYHAGVADVVRLCAQYQQALGVSIVPQGGNTGLVIGSIPDGTGKQIVLSLQRMNAVRAIDAANLTMTMEAGCVLQNLQETAEAKGFLFPLSLAAEGSCTGGGNLGTNAGGTQVVRFGNTRAIFALAWRSSRRKVKFGTA